MASDATPTLPAPLPVGAAVLNAVLLVDRLERPRPGYTFRSTSLPGHLIQAMIVGRTMHEVSGRRYQLEPHSVVWYHEDELVQGRVLESPWSFFTVNFIAPALAPPPFESRVRKVSPQVMANFAQLLDAWRQTTIDPAIREMRVQSLLLGILAQIASAGEHQPFRTDPLARLWWDLESKLRQDLAHKITLTRMQQTTGRSIATIARSCQMAVGMSPMRRIKQIRMSLARGLVRQSTLRLGEIGARVGYERVQEFSRDYRNHFHVSPRQDRLAWGASATPL